MPSTTRDNLIIATSSFGLLIQAIPKSPKQAHALVVRAKVVAHRFAPPDLRGDNAPALQRFSLRALLADALVLLSSLSKLLATPRRKRSVKRSPAETGEVVAGAVTTAMKSACAPPTRRHGCRLHPESQINLGLP